jgi:hypothetical protein
MITIGFRAAPRELTFAIFSTDEKKIVNVEVVKVPPALSHPAGLRHIRSTVLDLIREYKVERAGVKVTEPNARSINIDRVHIEGVILEAFASSNLKSFYIGQIASISKRLGIDRKNFKPMIAGELDPDVENWEQMSEKKREAILCAMGAEND